jgi:hypothetical protein
MQPGFGACHEIVNETIREIKLAKRRGDGIVFLELSPAPNGKTLPALVEAAHAGGYDKIAYATKNGGDGSVEFVDAAGAAEWFPLKRVRVCGVNRHACVENTVRGLINLISKKAKIEVAYLATAPGPRKYDGGGAYGQWEKEGIITIK